MLAGLAEWFRRLPAEQLYGGSNPSPGSMRFGLPAYHPPDPLFPHFVNPPVLRTRSDWWR